MDARELKSRLNGFELLVAVALGALLVAGLWQAYGVWLFASDNAHVE